MRQAKALEVLYQRWLSLLMKILRMRAKNRRLIHGTIPVYD